MDRARHSIDSKLKSVQTSSRSTDLLLSSLDLLINFLLMQPITAKSSCQLLGAVLSSIQKIPLIQQGNKIFARGLVRTMKALLKESKYCENMGHIQQVPESEAAAMRVLKQLLRLESEDGIEDIVKQLSGADEEILKRRVKLVADLQRLSKSEGESAEPLLRADIRAMGFKSLDQKFVPRQVLALYKVSTCESTRKTVLKLVFFHCRGMLSILGVGLKFSEVSIDRDFGITVEELSEPCWNRFWEDEEQVEGYKPIIFERLERSAGIIPQWASIDDADYLHFKPSWITCMEQLFVAKMDYRGVSPNEYPEEKGKQISANDGSSSSTLTPEPMDADTENSKHGQKISGQGPSTLSQVCKSGRKDHPVQVAVKLVLDQRGFELSPCKIAREKLRTDAEGLVNEGNGNPSEVGSGEHQTNINGAGSCRLSSMGPDSEVAETNATETLEFGSGEPGSSRNTGEVVDQEESCPPDTSKVDVPALIKPEITLRFGCDSTGRFKTLQASLSVDYQISRKFNPLVNKHKPSPDGYKYFHDDLHFSFGCKDDSATIEMESRNIQTEEGTIEFQAHSNISEAAKQLSHLGYQGVVGYAGTKAGVQYDKHSENTQGQERGTQQTIAVRGAYLKGTRFWVENTCEADELSFTAKSQYSVEPEDFRSLSARGQEIFRHTGMFSTVNFSASAKWTPEGNGEKIWAFEANQTLHKYVPEEFMPSIRTDGKPKHWLGKKWERVKNSAYFRQDKHRNREACSEISKPLASSVLQEYSKDFYVDHDFSHVEIDAVIKRHGPQVPQWTLKDPNQRSQAPELVDDRPRRSEPSAPLEDYAQQGKSATHSC